MTGENPPVVRATFESFRGAVVEAKKRGGGAVTRLQGIRVEKQASAGMTGPRKRAFFQT
jgi:hypothetical protein